MGKIADALEKRDKEEFIKVEKLSTFIPFVSIQWVITLLTAFAICFVSCDSIARIRIFSSLTKKGLNFIFLFDEGNTNSYVGVEMVGKGMIITTLQ